jgi:hypothetical protein
VLESSGLQDESSVSTRCYSEGRVHTERVLLRVMSKHIVATSSINQRSNLVLVKVTKST